jgi:hypothetical protein
MAGGLLFDWEAELCSVVPRTAGHRGYAAELEVLAEPVGWAPVEH